MAERLPDSSESLLQRGVAFRAEIAEIKQRTTLPHGDWYPFDTLSCLPIVKELLASDFDEDPPAQRWKPITSNTLTTLSRGHEPQIEAL